MVCYLVSLLIIYKVQLCSIFYIFFFVNRSVVLFTSAHIRMYSIFQTRTKTRCEGVSHPHVCKYTPFWCNAILGWYIIIQVDQKLNTTHTNDNYFYMFSAITSYLVHTSFSLCVIIPQSFSFIGQIVGLLCSFQNMFQMPPLAFQAHWQAERLSQLAFIIHNFPFTRTCSWLHWKVYYWKITRKDENDSQNV